MAVTTDNQLYRLLFKTKLEDTLYIGEEKSEYKLLKAGPHDTLSEALKIMNANSIHSLPLVESSDHGNKVLGFIDHVEIASHVVKSLTGVSDEDLKTGKVTADTIFNVQVSSVLGLSGNVTYKILQAGSLLFLALKEFAVGVRRAALVSEDTKTIRICSQSDITRFMFERTNLSSALQSFAAKPLTELLGHRAVVSVSSAASLWDTLKLMTEKKVSSVAVVDKDSGKLVANFSPDLAGLYENLTTHLHQSILEYLSSVNKSALEPKFITMNATFGELHKSLIDWKLHHIWLVDGDHKPTGIVSLTDVARLLWTYSTDENPNNFGRVFKVPACVELNIIRVYNLTRPATQVQIKFGDKPPVSTKSHEPSNALVVGQRCLFDIKFADTNKKISVQVVDASGTVIGTADIKVSWVLNAFGTANPSITYVSDKFKLRADNERNSHGRVELELSFDS